MAIKIKNEFRKLNNKKGLRHPKYIYLEDKNNYHYYGITHSKTTDGIKNIPLIKNPNPKDKTKSFLRPFPDKDKKSAFGKKLKGWKFHPLDIKKIKK